jgi:branched-chain amino acid aminotransferase
MSDRLVYLNGELVPSHEAKVSVFDHGLLYGDGVFEGIRVYGGAVFRLEEHIRRLYDSAKAIWLEIGIPPAEMSAIVDKTVQANGIRDGYVRLVVTRGAGDLGLDPRKCDEPTIFCIADTITLYPAEFYEKGLDVVTVAVPASHPESLNPAIKSCNYLNNILAKIEGIRAGVMEAIMLNHQGYVAECTGDNIFIVRDDVLKTPHPSAGILKGITRDTVVELAQREGLPVHEPSLTRYDLYTADECFLTGSAAEIVPVVKIDGRVIGDGVPGPITRRLSEAFRQLVNGKDR